MAQTVKNLPAVWDTQVRSLGREDPLEKEWRPTPVFLPGELHGQRGLVGCGPWGRRVRRDFVYLAAPGLSCSMQDHLVVARGI